MIVADEFLTSDDLHQDLNAAGAHSEQRDPFDRMQASQSRFEKLQLVSRN